MAWIAARCVKRSRCRCRLSGALWGRRGLPAASPHSWRSPLEQSCARACRWTLFWIGSNCGGDSIQRRRASHAPFCEEANQPIPVAVSIRGVVCATEHTVDDLIVCRTALHMGSMTCSAPEQRGLARRKAIWTYRGAAFARGIGGWGHVAADRGYRPCQKADCASRKATRASKLRFL